MEAITYSLKVNQNNSDEYYEDILKFTDEVLSGSKHLNPLIDEFDSYIRNNNPDEVQSHEEYVFELLMIGTYWRVYGIPSSKLNRIPQKLLEIVVYLRYKYGSLKSSMDTLRGILMTLFLVQNGDTADFPDLTLDNFDKLLRYLTATGEFLAEIKRLKIWRDFLASKTPETISKYLLDAFILSDWFETRSEVVLGRYTKNVQKFLTEKHQDHLWKEDVIFCGRKPVEYHLIMVGAEIMNRAFKKDFDKRPRKALVLPACIRSNIGKECRAKDSYLGLKCMRCSKDCNAHRLTDMGVEYGFEVYIISHESYIFSKITKKDSEELGIIGVACVSNLIAGGINAKLLGLAAQCVLLDYRGCKNHWLEKDIPTDINVNEMMNLFNFKEIQLNAVKIANK